MKLLMTFLLICLLPVSGQSISKQSIEENSETGALTWGIKANGVYFSLTQLLPDQVRAFYVNRGFSLETIEPYALSCVYMSVLRNDSAPGSIHFITDNWVVLFDNEQYKLKPAGDWIAEFENSAVKKSAILAFRWAQFPAEQEYKTGGDWNQGMLSIGSLQGTTFDVLAKWDLAGEELQARLTGVKCAEE